MHLLASRLNGRPRRLTRRLARFRHGTRRRGCVLDFLLYRTRLRDRTRLHGVAVRLRRARGIGCLRLPLRLFTVHLLALNLLSLVQLTMLLLGVGTLLRSPRIAAGARRVAHLRVLVHGTGARGRDRAAGKMARLRGGRDARAPVVLRGAQRRILPGRVDVLTLR